MILHSSLSFRASGHQTLEKEFLNFPKQRLQLLLVLTVATKLREGYGSHSLTQSAKTGPCI